MTTTAEAKRAVTEMTTLVEILSAAAEAHPDNEQISEALDGSIDLLAEYQRNLHFVRKARK